MTKRKYSYRGRTERPIRSLRAVVLIAVAVVMTVVAISAIPGEEQGRVNPDFDPGWLIVSLPADIPQHQVDYTGFHVSFNPQMHVPNYVAWELTRGELDGEASRSRASFQPDPDVPGCATADDYRHSGFDRGHMVPAADMKWSAQAMADCHYLTNIVPQDHSLNSGRWNSLEQKCRTLAQRDSALVVICGPVLTDRIVRTIGDSRVAVPERFFKVLFEPYAETPRAVAFIMPNRAVPDPLASLAVSVDQLEEITGYDFFSTLPDSIENQMEATVNLREWGIR